MSEFVWIEKGRVAFNNKSTMATTVPVIAPFMAAVLIDTTAPFYFNREVEARKTNGQFVLS